MQRVWPAGGATRGGEGRPAEVLPAVWRRGGEGGAAHGGDERGNPQRCGAEEMTGLSRQRLFLYSFTKGYRRCITSGMVGNFTQLH